MWEGKAITIIRNDGYRKDAGKLAIRAFGSLGTAGGHKTAARAEIPLDLLLQKGIKGYGSTLEQFIRKQLNV